MVGATVAVWYYVHPPLGQSEASEKVQGVTDASGIFTASQTNTGSIGLGFQASKAGYYTTTKGHEFAKFKDSDPSKWNPSETLVLKKIGHPVPLYAKWVDVWPLKGDGAAGYDLVTGDWVAPYGTGANTDVIFTRKFDKRSATDFDYTLTISFPNSGDGIQEFSVPESEKWSELRSPHEASADGYQAQLIRTNFVHLDKSRLADYDENKIYFFRVHTLYGKIYGDPILLNFHYYLNPTPDDRNIEFDPKQNLLKKVNGIGENVKNP